MGNCLGSRKNHDQGHTLGSGNAGATKTSSGGQPLGGKPSPSNGREAMLAAAEERRKNAENRGVKGSGGKLSKQLAEQKKQNPLTAQDESPPERIVWD